MSGASATLAILPGDHLSISKKLTLQGCLPSNAPPPAPTPRKVKTVIASFAFQFACFSILSHGLGVEWPALSWCFVAIG